MNQEEEGKKRSRGGSQRPVITAEDGVMNPNFQSEGIVRDTGCVSIACAWPPQGEMTREANGQVRPPG